MEAGTFESRGLIYILSELPAPFLPPGFLPLFWCHHPQIPINVNPSGKGEIILPPSITQTAPPISQSKCLWRSSNKLVTKEEVQGDHSRGPQSCNGQPRGTRGWKGPSSLFQPHRTGKSPLATPAPHGSIATSVTTGKGSQAKETSGRASGTQGSWAPGQWHTPALYRPEAPARTALLSAHSSLAITSAFHDHSSLMPVASQTFSQPSFSPDHQDSLNTGSVDLTTSTLCDIK